MESYRVAGIDVHKSMLAVVVADAAQDGEWQFQRRKFGTATSELQALRAWFEQQQVREAVMNSTAKYGKPVWQALEGRCELFLAPAQSNRAPRGRQRDFVDAERLLRRQVAGELIVSFVPDPEQRLWGTLSRTKHQLTRDRVRIYSQLESLLEHGRIKLAICVTDLLGVSCRRMMRALAKGETDPARLAAMADANLRATPEQLIDALAAAPTLSRLHREMIGLFLQRLELIEGQIDLLKSMLATALQSYTGAVERLAEVPGFEADAAQQVIAEIGPTAATFSSPEEPAATAAFFLPQWWATRYNRAVKKQSFMWDAAQALCTRMRRKQRSPLRVFPLKRFPALSALPEHNPAQLAACGASGNWRMSTPSSATNTQAVTRSTPRILSNRRTNSACGSIPWLMRSSSSASRPSSPGQLFH